MINSSQSILISIDDFSLRRYLQQYPFATGPDKGMNEKALSTIRTSFRKRPSDADMHIRLIAPDEAQMDAASASRAASLFAAIGIDAPTTRKLMNDFGWRVKTIPKGSGNLLSIGCGEGHELVFIRAMFPEMKITAVDYRQNLLPGLADAVGLTFIEGDLNKELCSLKPASYQVVFSNHTLEHMYDPDETIGYLARLLEPGGHLVSGIPLDGSLDGVFQDEIGFFSQYPNRIHGVDSILLDFGHPWKTNPADLRNTLQKIGFGNIDVLQRDGHFGREFRGSRRKYRLVRAVGSLLNRTIFGSLHSLVRFVFPATVPLLVLRIVFAAETRVWFGSNRLKNYLAPDTVFVAVRT